MHYCLSAWLLIPFWMVDGWLLVVFDANFRLSRDQHYGSLSLSSPEFLRPLKKDSKTKGAVNLYPLAIWLWPLLRWLYSLVFMGNRCFSINYRNFRCGPVCWGMAGAVGITFAHELIHRKNVGKIAGEILLLSVTYHHWSVEHGRGIEMWVLQGASLPIGWELFCFFATLNVGGLRSALCIEAAKTQNKNVYRMGPGIVISGLILRLLLYIWYYPRSDGKRPWRSFIGFVDTQLEAVNYFDIMVLVGDKSYLTVLSAFRRSILGTIAAGSRRIFLQIFNGIGSSSSSKRTI